MELYIICAFVLLLNSGLTVNVSRRPWTTDGERYFNNVSLVFNEKHANRFVFVLWRSWMNGDGFGCFWGTEGLGQGGSEL